MSEGACVETQVLRRRTVTLTTSEMVTIQNVEAADALRVAIEEGIAGAKVEVERSAGAGHFSLTVRAGSFAGKPMVRVHRIVYAAIAHLMEGDPAPVHAIDRLRTLAG